MKRVYEKRDLTDGRRVLVDRLWPRGVKKGTQNVDLWIKEVAPSNELRKWFSHDPKRWEEFKKKYEKELRGNNKLDELVKMVKETDITLVYAAKDTKHNNAVALAEFIKKRLKEMS
jgi:uncharacterized protein YeaO (DUF488 family)